MEKNREFKEFIKNADEEVKIEAILERAFSDKVTTETINQKIDAQINSINFGIKKINPKFTEKSKNYDIVKDQISEIMEKYETALKQMGEFYDKKIEQLILRKMELQTNLVGSIARQQYLINRKNIKNKVKDNDKFKNILVNGIKFAIEKIKIRKQKNDIDVSEINKLKDKEEIEKEHSIKVKNSIESTEQKIKANKEYMEKINKEIYLITIEIKKINDRKKEALFSAIETEEKWLITKIKKPKPFERITRFFASRINTPKVINKNLIEPLNERIDDFIENELACMK